MKASLRQAGLVFGILGVIFSINLPTAIPAITEGGKPGTFTVILANSLSEKRRQYRVIGEFASDDKTVLMTGAILEETYSDPPPENQKFRAYYFGTQHVSRSSNGGFMAYLTVVMSLVGLIAWGVFAWSVAQLLRPE